MQVNHDVVHPSKIIYDFGLFDYGINLGRKSTGAVSRFLN